MTCLSWSDANNSPVSGLRSLPMAGIFLSSSAQADLELREAPIRMVSVVLLELADKRQSRWVLLEQDPDSLAASRWKFPGEPVGVEERPLQAALRAVIDNVRILEAGLPMSLAGLENQFRSVSVEFMAELSISEDAQQADYENTLVFWYHVKKPVNDITQVELQDAKQVLGRSVKLAGILDVLRLEDEEALCPASARLWQAYWVSRPT